MLNATVTAMRLAWKPRTLKDKLNRQTQEIEELRSLLAGEGGHQSSGRHGTLASSLSRSCQLHNALEVAVPSPKLNVDTCAGRSR